MITEAQIRRAAVNVSNANVGEFVRVFNEWAGKFGINTPLRTAHLLAQLMHECNCLKNLEENLNYSADGLRKVFPKYFTIEQAKEYARKPEKIANRVYANRMGNGNEASGDGWKYKGRGCIMITGRAMYANYENSPYCNGNLTAHPEWLAKFPGALKSALWFWKENGLNELADRDDVNAITRRINGGTNGLSMRLYYLRRFKRELGV